MILKRLPLVLLLLLAFAVPVLGAVAKEIPKEAPDTRLDQKITYKAEAKKLPEVLSEITKQTGVRFGVAAGARFWSVRQRKVTLYLKDMPLREFMAQLEKLLDYHFSRSGKPGEYTYALWQDLNGRSKEQNDLKAQQEARELHRRRALDETLRDTELALMMTPDQAKAIKDKNPWLAYLAGTDRGRAFSQLIQSIPRDKFDTLLQGDMIHLSLNDLSPSGQEALKKIGSLVDYPNLGKDFGGNLYEGKLSGGGVVTGISIEGSGVGEDDSELTPAAPFWLDVSARPAAAPDSQDNFGIDSFAIARSDVPNSDPKSFPSLMNSGEMAARSDLSNKLRKSESDRAKPDPELDRVVRYGSLKPGKDQSGLSFLLQELAELFGFNVMYEYYPEPGDGMSTDLGDRRLGDVLDELSSWSLLGWTKTGKVIRFRHVNWAERRSWEIPMEWVTAWESVIEKKQQLDFDTLVDIVSKMTDKQIEHNFTYGRPPSSSIDDPLVAELFKEAGVGQASWSRTLIELYSRLSPSQKAKAWSKDGISFDEIADDPLFQGEAARMADVPAYDRAIRLYKGKPSGQTISVGDKTVNLDFGVGDRPVADASQTTNIDMTMAFWLGDLPAQERDGFAKSLTPELLANAENEPIRISHSVTLWDPRVDQVKAQLDKIKKAREEKQKKAAQGRTSP